MVQSSSSFSIIGQPFHKVMNDLCPVQTIEGEVFAFEDALDIIVLQGSSESSKSVSLRVLKANCVRKVQLNASSNWQLIRK